jgi:hypothetical protein
MFIAVGWINLAFFFFFFFFTYNTCSVLVTYLLYTDKPKVAILAVRCIRSCLHTVLHLFLRCSRAQWVWGDIPNTLSCIHAHDPMSLTTRSDKLTYLSLKRSLGVDFIRSAHTWTVSFGLGLLCFVSCFVYLSLGFCLFFLLFFYFAVTDSTFVFRFIGRG